MAEALGEWADAFMEEGERLRAEVDDRAEGLLRALNRRTRRQEERQKKAQAEEARTEVGKR